MKNYAFGVDIGGTSIKMGLLDTEGVIVGKWSIPTRIESGGGYILGDVTEAVSRAIAEYSIPRQNVLGIGLGIPGPIGGDGTVYKCLNLGWGVFNAEDELRRLSGLKVRAGNDGNVAALGEMWLGAGRGFRNIVMLTLGTGIGGGVLMDGNIVTGAHGAAGEIGHINVKRDEIERCVCGNRGCLEQYCSAKGFARETAKYLRNLVLLEGEKTMLRNLDFLSAKMILDASQNRRCYRD